jgi:putative transposase
VVWIPKYRRKILNPGVKEYLERVWPKILKEMPGVEIVEQNIQVDHIHTIMVIPPKYSVSEVIGRIKGKSAGRLRKKFAWLENVYWKENIVWSPGYFVSTVGLNEQSIIKYVRWQAEQDSGQAKLVL